MEAVTVVARFRGAESGDDDFGDWALTDNTIKHNEKHHEFNFDAVLNPSRSQAELYEAAGRKIINFFCDGYNATIFAYGQSGSGKTFSMLGPETVTETLIDKDVEITPEVEAMFGITPRATFHLFENIKEGQAKGTKYDVRVSYIEVYNEMINDILACPPGQNLKIREFPNQGMCVIGMLENTANSPEAVFEAISAGTANRIVCSTGQNARSSRSHTVFIYTLEQTSIEGTVKKAKINLVDLAGSEKLSKTGAQGQALLEAKNINLSLTTLGRCIKALTSGSAEFVPYRESKLTLILKESLSGAAMTVLIVTGSMRKIHQEETIGTMQFAERAKMVKTAAKSNTKRSYDELERLVNKLTTEVDALKKALKDGGGVIPEGLSAPAENPEPAPAEKGVSSVELEEWKAKYETLEETSARQIEELKHSIERAETKMGNSEFVGIKEEMDSFKDRLGEASEQVERVLKEKERQKTEYEEKISKSIVTFESLQCSLAAKKEEASHLKHKLNHFQGLLIEKNAELFKIEQEIQDSGHSEQRLQSHIKELEKILTQEKEKHAEVHSEIEKFKHQLKEAEKLKHESETNLREQEKESENILSKIEQLEQEEKKLVESMTSIREQCEDVKQKSLKYKSKIEKLENEEKLLIFEYKQKEEEYNQEQIMLKQQILELKLELEGVEESAKHLNEEAKQQFIKSHVSMFEDQLHRLKEDHSSCYSYLSEVESSKSQTKSHLEAAQTENKDLLEKLKEVNVKKQQFSAKLETEKQEKNKLHEELREIEIRQQKLIQEEEEKVFCGVQDRLQPFIDQSQELKNEIFKKQEDLQKFKSQAEEEVEKVKADIIQAKKQNFELEIKVKNLPHELQVKKSQISEEIGIIQATTSERLEEIKKLREILALQEEKIKKSSQEIEKLEKNIKQKAGERDTERKNSIIRATLIPKRNTIFNKSLNPGQEESKFGGLMLKKTDNQFLNEALKEAEEIAKSGGLSEIYKVNYEMQAIKALYGDQDESVPVKKTGVILEEDEEDN